MVAPPTTTPHCLEYWGCQFDPFAFPVETRRIVPTRSLRLGLAGLRNAIESRVPTTIVRGVQGIGKSTLCAALRDAIGEGVWCVVLSHCASTWQEIAGQFAEAAPAEDGAARFVGGRFPPDERLRASHTIVLIDDAHQLGRDALAGLIRRFEVTPGQLCFVLFTDRHALPVFENWIDERHELHEIELTPLSEDETSYYVSRRLSQASSDGREIFSADAIRSVYEVTKGIPGDIDAVCRSSLEMGYCENAETIDSSLVRRAQQLHGTRAAAANGDLHAGVNDDGEKRNNAVRPRRRPETRRGGGKLLSRAGTLSSLLSSIALDSPALLKPPESEASPVRRRQPAGRESGVRLMESRIGRVPRGVMWVGIGGSVGMVVLLSFIIWLSGQSPPYEAVVGTSPATFAGISDAAKAQVEEAELEQTEGASPGFESEAGVAPEQPAITPVADAAAESDSAAAELAQVPAGDGDGDSRRVGSASNRAPVTASSDSSSPRTEPDHNVVIAAPIPVPGDSAASGDAGPSGPIVAAARIHKVATPSRQSVSERPAAAVRSSARGTETARAEVPAEPSRELLPLDEAVECLRQAFQSLYAIPQVQTRSIVRVKEDGERMLATLELAWVYRDGEVRTTAEVQRVGAHPKYRVESRVDADGREEIAVRSEGMVGKAAMGTDETVDPFSGTLFRFEDFRPQSVGLFDVERLESGVLNQEGVYIVTARPRGPADYARVEFFITKLDMTLFERRYYRDAESSAFRTVQHPQSDLSSVGDALVPTRLVVFDRQYAARGESRVEEVGLASDQDVRLVALSVEARSEPGASAVEAAPPLPPVSMAATAETEAPKEAPVLPAVIKRVAPEYPSRALRHGLEGWVVVEFGIGKKGEVLDPEVVASEPGRQFDHAALRAIKKWRFSPVVEAGEPVEREGFRYRFGFTVDD